MNLNRFEFQIRIINFIIFYQLQRLTILKYEIVIILIICPLIIHDWSASILLKYLTLIEMTIFLIFFINEIVLIFIYLNRTIQIFSLDSLKSILLVIWYAVLFYFLKLILSFLTLIRFLIFFKVIFIKLTHKFVAHFR